MIECYFDDDEKEKLTCTYSVLDAGNISVQVYGDKLLTTDYMDLNQKYCSITIIDEVNKVFLKLFYCLQTQFSSGRIVSCSFESSCYIKRKIRLLDKLPLVKNDFLIQEIELWHENLISFIGNKSIEKENRIDYSHIIKLKETEEIDTIIINKNNINKLDIVGGWSIKKKFINATTIEEYQKVRVTYKKEIDLNNLFHQVDLFSIICNIFVNTKINCYKISIKIDELYYDFYYSGIERNPKFKLEILNSKIDFLSCLQKYYKSEILSVKADRNKYLPFESHKIPINIEDKFLIYYKFLDIYYEENYKKLNNNLYFTKFLTKKWCKNIFLNKFSKKDLRLLWDEIRNLRNHYSHEGYYLKNNFLPIYGFKTSQLKRKKRINKDWIYKACLSLKRSCYFVIYNNILKITIDENDIISIIDSI